METLNLNYSLYNIPIPGRLQYQRKMIEKSENFVRRIRWKHFFIQNPNVVQHKQTYGFKTTVTPPQSKELKNFEDDLFNMIRNIQFRATSNEFQNNLKKDVKTILSSDKVFVNADKSRNIYKMDPKDYRKLMQDNITKDYKKNNKSRVRKHK